MLRDQSTDGESVADQRECRYSELPRTRPSPRQIILHGTNNRDVGTVGYRKLISPPPFLPHIVAAAGSWAQSSCDRNGQTGVGSSQGVWTAPSSGSATVGGTRGGGYSYGVDTIQVELSAGPAPPTNPVTQRPTSAPTEATDEAIVNFCGSFISTCGTSLGWSSASSCRASVVRLMTGDSGDVGGNTLACRICEFIHDVLCWSLYPQRGFGGNGAWRKGTAPRRGPHPRVCAYVETAGGSPGRRNLSKSLKGSPLADYSLFCVAL